MLKSNFERIGGTYHREDDYLIPNVIPPESSNIGIWGMRRKNYLVMHKKPIYTGLLLSGELNAHLEEIDRTAEAMLDLLITQMAKREGVTEQLKASDQMAWVGAMNNIRARAEDTVYTELIYS